MDDLKRRISAAYETARARTNAPHRILDDRFNAIPYRLRLPDGLSVSEQRQHGADLCQYLTTEAAFFERCATVSDADLLTVGLNTHPAAPVSPADQARQLYDCMTAKGVRFEPGTDGGLSIRPARLLNDFDRAQIKRLKAQILDIWRQRNDVWEVG